MRKSWPVIVACGLLLATSVFPIVAKLRESTPTSVPHVSLDRPDGLSCEIYLPPNLDRSQNHPLVFGSSPIASADDVLGAWREAADRFQLIVVGSRNYRNGPTDAHQTDLQLETLAIVMRDYPVDPQRVYAVGLSGGAMNSYSLITAHPELFRGLVVNTAMMPQHMPGNPPFDSANFPHDKIAVFLASPTDFRYGEMHQDRKLLESFGWKIDWLEFEGGHHYAPSALYVKAAAWLGDH
jgi:poly(3-hydroxybutyrate) depolymerase